MGAERAPRLKVHDVKGSRFAHVLHNVNKGRTEIEINDELTEVIKAVRNTESPGEVRVTLKINPGNGNELYLTADVRTKIPKKKSAASMFYADDEGGLHRDDPNQMNLDLRE